MFFADSPSWVRLRDALVVLTLAVLAAALPVTAWADDAESAKAAAADHDHADGAHDHEASHDEADHDEAGHGAHGDEAGVPPLLQFDFGSAIVNLAIFLGVLAILSKFVWPVILDGLRAREQKIHGDLVAAEKANAEAKSLLEDYQVKLDEASGKVQAMLAEARVSAEANGQQIVEQAKSEAEQQRVRALADIETAKKVALADLAGQTSDMAMAVAGQVVGRELNPSDHAELIRQSLERLPSQN